jgi:hypothetical protein
MLDLYSTFKALLVISTGALLVSAIPTQDKPLPSHFGYYPNDTYAHHGARGINPSTGGKLAPIGTDAPYGLSGGLTQTDQPPMASFFAGMKGPVSVSFSSHVSNLT